MENDDLKYKAGCSLFFKNAIHGVFMGFSWVIMGFSWGFPVIFTKFKFQF